MNSNRVKFILTVGMASIVGLLYLVCVRNAIIINDDYQALYTTWMMSLGRIQGIDFNVDSFSLMFDIFYPFYYLFGETITILFFFRFIMLTLIFISYFQVYLIIKKFTSFLSSLAVLLILSVSTPMYMRGLDLRPDLFILVCWLQLFLILSMNNFSYKYVLSLGVITAIAFLFKFKALIILVIIFISFSYRVFKRVWSFQTFIKNVGIFALAFFFIITLYVLYTVVIGGISPYLEKTFQLIVSSVDGSIKVEGLKLDVFRQALSNDVLFWVMFLGGIIVFFFSILKKRSEQPLLILSILTVALLSVIINPHYYSYNLAVLYPLLSVVIAIFVNFCEIKFRLDIPQIRIFLIVVYLCFTNYSIYEFYNYSLKNRITHQLALNEFISETTSTSDAIFAYEGIGLFRPSTFHWRTSAIKTNDYYSGKYSVWSEIKEVMPKLIILNYRIPNWMTKYDRMNLFNNYVRVTPQIMVIGFVSKSVEEFNLLTNGEYEVLSSDGYNCTVDGNQVKNGTVLTLSEGRHLLDSKENESCVLRWYIDHRKITTLMNANKGEFPYLVSPFLKLFF